MSHLVAHLPSRSTIVAGPYDPGIRERRFLEVCVDKKRLQTSVSCFKFINLITKSIFKSDNLKERAIRCSDEQLLILQIF